jgi:hypothetical protein
MCPDPKELKIVNENCVLTPKKKRKGARTTVKIVS